jgi:hypothetical protein
MANDRRRVERMASIQAAPFQRPDKQLRGPRLREWAAALGVPGRPAVTEFEAGGFGVEAVGVAVSRVAHAPGRVFVPTGGESFMLAWGIRIKPAGCRAFLEARFDPSGAMSYSLHDLDLADATGNARALAGLDLLRAWTPPGGRPADCLERCECAADAIAARGEEPTRAKVAKFLSVQLETVEQCFRRERTRSGRTWSDIKRAALRKAGRTA